MSEKLSQYFASVFVLAALLGCVWLYAAQPKSLSDTAVKASETIDSLKNKGELAIGTYEADKELFAKGLADFRAERYESAREFFRKSDPEARDAKNQFYIAYSFYRQGWSKFSHDNELYKKGLEALPAVEKIDANFAVNDEDLKLKTAADLRKEFEEGMKVSAGDFNPLRIFDERK